MIFSFSGCKHKLTKEWVTKNLLSNLHIFKWFCSMDGTINRVIAGKIYAINMCLSHYRACIGPGLLSSHFLSFLALFSFLLQLVCTFFHFPFGTSSNGEPHWLPISLSIIITIMNILKGYAHFSLVKAAINMCPLVPMKKNMNT